MNRALLNGLYMLPVVLALVVTVIVVAYIVGTVQGPLGPQEPFAPYLWFFDDQKPLNWLVQNSWHCALYYEYQYPYYTCQTGDDNFETVMVSFNSAGKMTWMLFRPRPGLQLGEVVSVFGRWRDTLRGPRYQPDSSGRRYALRWPDLMVILFEHNILTLQSEVSSIHWYIRADSAS